MHAKGKRLTVDVATWSVIWNLTALASTQVDRILTMSTYTNSSSSYFANLGMALEAVPLQMLGIGFECDLTLSPAALAARIDDMLVAGVQEIDIWRTPIPDYWWPQIARFVSGA